MCTYRTESTSDSYNIAASCFFFSFTCYRLSRSFATEPNMKAGIGHLVAHFTSHNDRNLYYIYSQWRRLLIIKVPYRKLCNYRLLNKFKEIFYHLSPLNACDDEESNFLQCPISATDIKLQKIERSVIDHCFLLNMSMDRRLKVFFFRRFIFGLVVYVKKWRCGETALWKMRRKNLPPNYRAQIFLVFRVFHLSRVWTNVWTNGNDSFSHCFLLIDYLQKDITMKWLVTINFRWCNYPKVHNHSIIQRMYHQSQVHLWHRR